MNIIGSKGGWVNQYAQPSDQMFNDRTGGSIAYVIIKYGLSQYELAANSRQVPWLGERMGEAGAGIVAIDQWERFATELAQQCGQPGCIGGVINLEESDGGWNTDDGTATLQLIRKFRELRPDKPLFAALDTRGTRPAYPYQQACATLCDGVMPMVYPKAFGQSPREAVAASLTTALREAWAGKPIIPAIQTYDGIGGPLVEATMVELSGAGVSGISAYTLGHATEEEWGTFRRITVMYKDQIPAQQPPAGATTTDTRALLIEARMKYLEVLDKLAFGTPDELLSFALFWKAASTPKVV